MNYINSNHNFQVKFYDCNPDILNDSNITKLYIREACKELRLGEIEDSFFLPNSFGTTFTVLLSNGTLIATSDSKTKSFIVQLYTNTRTKDFYAAFNYLKTTLNATNYNLIEILPDTFASTNNCMEKNNYRDNISTNSPSPTVITLSGSAGGVAKSVLSILNRACEDKLDPVHSKINNCKIHLVDSKQKSKDYYESRFVNLKNKFTIHEFNLNDTNKFTEHLMKTKTNIVVDVSFADTVDMMHCCNSLGVIYINSALESTSVDANELLAGFSLQERYKIFESHRHEFKNTTAILCSGMNPGVVNWMALELMKKRPYAKPKSCYIIEEDTSFFEDKNLIDKDTIYTTWYPEGFLDEAIYSYPTFMKKHMPLFLYKEVYDLEFKVTIGEKQFYGCLMPHEEAITLGKMYDMETGFIYKINDHTTKLIRDNIDDVEVLWGKQMKVLDPDISPLIGNDLVGILLVYDNDEIYMYNSLNNKEIYKKYKTNATYHQVASGVYGALATILLDAIPMDLYYVEELLNKTNCNYGKYLSYHLQNFVVGENPTSDGDLMCRMRDFKK